MKKFIRYFNQNRIKVIITIFIIVFIIILIMTVNNILKQINDRMNSNNTNIIEDTSFPSESVITGESVSEKRTENNIQIIKQFVDYCNNKEYENAYNLLSDECKEEVYPTLEDFSQIYCNSIFNTPKTYSLELLYNSVNTYTYNITFVEDNILSTGIINSSQNKQDCITIVENTNGDKLNISNFIEKEEVNKSSETDGVKIEVLNRVRYRNYEQYDIKIENNTDKTISISDGINSNDICLVDANNVEYNSILNEIPISSLEIGAHAQKKISISFYKTYNTYRTIEKMRFKNIISDLTEYELNPEIPRIVIDIEI